jgi:hypothetical protein
MLSVVSGVVARKALQDSLAVFAERPQQSLSPEALRLLRDREWPGLLLGGAQQYTAEEVRTHFFGLRIELARGLQDLAGYLRDTVGPAMAKAKQAKAVSGRARWRRAWQHRPRRSRAGAAQLEPLSRQPLRHAGRRLGGGRRRAC